MAVYAISAVTSLFLFFLLNYIYIICLLTTMTNYYEVNKSGIKRKIIRNT
jgi:hypothetical protein